MSNDVFCTCNGDQIYRLQIEGVLGITLPVLSTHRVGWFDNSKVIRNLCGAYENSSASNFFLKLDSNSNSQSNTRPHCIFL